jgi:hypothetical protein
MTQGEPTERAAEADAHKVGVRFGPSARSALAYVPVSSSICIISAPCPPRQPSQPPDHRLTHTIFLTLPGNPAKGKRSCPASRRGSCWAQEKRTVPP